MHILKWKVCMNFGNCYWTIVGPVVLCFNLVETSVHRLIFDDDDDGQNMLRRLHSRSSFFEMGDS